MDGGVSTENQVPQTEVGDLTEKRNAVRARTIIDGMSSAHYLGDKISLFAKRLSPGSMPVNAVELNPKGFGQVLGRLKTEFEATKQKLDFLQEGTLSLNYTDNNMFAIAGMGMHPSHLEPYYFNLHFSREESLNDFIDWMKENPNEAMTQIFERMMLRPGQDGKSFDQASYFAQTPHAERDYPFTESHPFKNNKISKLLLKKDTEDKILQRNY